MISIDTTVDMWKLADCSWTWSNHNDYDGEIEEHAITSQIYAELMDWA